MLTLESEMTVNGLTGREITDFLLDCGDDSYQAWWPGTHLELHVLEHGSGDDHVGDVVLMDEYVGSRRVRMVGEVIEAVAGETDRMAIPPSRTAPAGPADLGTDRRRAWCSLAPHHHRGMARAWTRA